MRVRPIVASAVLGSGLLGCGDHSLDATSTAGAVASTGGTAAATGSSTTDENPGTQDDGNDFPPEDGAFCPPGCDVELETRWTYRGELPDPDRREPDVYRLEAMTTVFDGTLVFAERRRHDIFITRVSTNGNQLWHDWLPINQGSEIRDLSASADGTIWYSGTALLGLEGGLPVIHFGRFAHDDITDFESQWTQLQGVPGATPRMGTIFPFDDFRAGLVVIDQLAGVNAGATERIDVFDVNRNGAIDNIRFVTFQPLTEPAGTPVGAKVTNDTLAVAYPSFTGVSEQGYVVWLRNFVVRDTAPLPGKPDDMESTPTGRAIAVSHQWSEGQLEIFVDEMGFELPSIWEFRAVIDSTTRGNADVVVDEAGFITVAVPATRRVNGQTRSRVELISLTPTGQVHWNATLPLPFQPGERPIALELADDGRFKVGGTVNDRVRIDEVEPICACE